MPFLLVTMSALMLFAAANVWGIRLAEVLPAGIRSLYGITFVFSTLGAALGVFFTWPVAAYVTHAVAAVLMPNTPSFRTALSALGYAHAPLLWIAVLLTALAAAWPIPLHMPLGNLDELVALMDSTRFAQMATQLRLVGTIAMVWTFASILHRICRTALWRAALVASLPFVMLMLLQRLLMVFGGGL